MLDHLDAFLRERAFQRLADYAGRRIGTTQWDLASIGFSAAAISGVAQVGKAAIVGEGVVLWAILALVWVFVAISANLVRIPMLAARRDGPEHETVFSLPFRKLQMAVVATIIVLDARTVIAGRPFDLLPDVAVLAYTAALYFMCCRTPPPREHRHALASAA